MAGSPEPEAQAGEMHLDVLAAGQALQAALQHLARALALPLAQLPPDRPQPHLRSEGAGHELT